MLDEIGLAGQQKIAESRLAILGAGGVGSPAALYLAAAGIGNIAIVDHDIVDISNLHRQLLYTSNDIGSPKAVTAVKFLRDRFPETRFDSIENCVDDRFLDSFIDSFDLVVDGTDNFNARFCINDSCVRAGKPLFHGGVLKFVGQVLTVFPGETCCYRCIFGKEPEGDVAIERSHGGIIGPVPGMVGSLLATQVIQYVVGMREKLGNKIIYFDAASMTFRTIEVHRQPGCTACGHL